MYKRPGAVGRLGRFSIIGDYGVIPPDPEVPPVSWPYPWTLGSFLVMGYGSSTMAGVAPGAGVSPFNYAATDSSASNSTTDAPGWNNKGAGGTNSATILSTVTAASAAQKAADTIFSFGGIWTAVADPASVHFADAQLAVAQLGHTRFLMTVKHNDAATRTGGRDTARLRKLGRLLSNTYPGRFEDTALMFKKWPATDPADLAAQLLDQVPPSLDRSSVGDNAHLNPTGNQVLSRLSYQPFEEALRGGPPFVGNQRVFSMDWAAANTNGGLVCEIPHDYTNYPSLAGVTVSFTTTETDYAVVIESNRIRIRRITSAPITEAYRYFNIFVTKNGKRRSSWVLVWFADPNVVSGKSARFQQDWLFKEGPLAGVSNSGKKLTIALGLKFRGVADGEAASAGTTRRLFMTDNGSAITLEAKASNKLGLTVRNPSNVNVVNLDSAASINDSVMTWVIYTVDTTTGVQIAKVSVNGSVNTNVPTADGILMLGQGNATGLGRIFSSADTGGSLIRADVQALWMAEGYIDIAVSGKRDLFYNSSTMASVIPANGIVDGITPFFWANGPCLAAGLNLAQPDDYWWNTEKYPILLV